MNISSVKYTKCILLIIEVAAILNIIALLMSHHLVQWVIDDFVFLLGPEFFLPEVVSYLGERGVLCVGNG